MDVLKVCTWNIKQGQYLPTLLKEISTQEDFAKLDVMAIQESFIHNEVEDAEKIAAKLGPQYKYFQENVKITFGLLQGNAFIWNSDRIKITKKESFFLPDVRGKHTTRLENVFFRLLPKQDRNCLVLEGTFGNKSIRIYVTHLDVLGYTHKRFQLNSIFRHALSQKPADFSMIIGDFNTYKFVSRPKWRNLAEDAEAAGFSDLTTEILWTFSRRKVRFKQKLDSIFIKPYDYKYRSWSLDINGSDHIPVFSDITLPSKSKSLANKGAKKRM